MAGGVERRNKEKEYKPLYFLYFLFSDLWGRKIRVRCCCVGRVECAEKFYFFYYIIYKIEKV